MRPRLHRHSGRCLRLILLALLAGLLWFARADQLRRELGLSDAPRSFSR